MSERPWYRRYGSDFIAGTLGLSLEEKGAYSIVLDLIYDRRRPIPDDARYIAGVCGCSVRKWTAIKFKRRFVKLLLIETDLFVRIAAMRPVKFILTTFTLCLLAEETLSII